MLELSKFPILFNKSFKTTEHCNSVGQSFYFTSFLRSNYKSNLSHTKSLNEMIGKDVKTFLKVRVILSRLSNNRIQQRSELSGYELTGIDCIKILKSEYFECLSVRLFSNYSIYGNQFRHLLKFQNMRPKNFEASVQKVFREN